MNREDSALEAAAKRLETALGMMEQRLAQTASVGDPKLVNDENARLAAELDRVRHRERELESAGAEASAALGRAITELRATLAREA
jgi:Domain of unknown function (DUF4164)